MYDLAIIYHEFAHTMVFREEISRKKTIDIYDERIAVLMYENPVRIRKGYEPRYTYSLNDKSQTINIITHQVLSGSHSIKNDDPTVLVPTSSKDALK